jgi:hypothetical protein
MYIENEQFHIISSESRFQILIVHSSKFHPSFYLAPAQGDVQVVGNSGPLVVPSCNLLSTSASPPGEIIVGLPLGVCTAGKKYLLQQHLSDFIPQGGKKSQVTHNQ